MKLHALVLTGGTSSIISSIAASIAGYRSRKNSVRGGQNSCSEASAVAAGSFSVLMTSAYGRRASSRTNSANGAAGAGPAYASLHSRTLTASAVAEKAAKCEEESGSLHGSSSLSGSSDTSSNFGAQYLPSALGMTFVPITLVFRDLR